jgi:hypothetical protein
VIAADPAWMQSASVRKTTTRTLRRAGRGKSHPRGHEHTPLLPVFGTFLG